MKNLRGTAKARGQTDYGNVSSIGNLSAWLSRPSEHLNRANGICYGAEAVLRLLRSERFTRAVVGLCAAPSSPTFLRPIPSIAATANDCPDRPSADTGIALCIMDKDRAALQRALVPVSLRLAFDTDAAGALSMQSRRAFASLRSCVSKPSVNRA